MSCTVATIFGLALWPKLTLRFLIPRQMLSVLSLFLMRVLGLGVVVLSLLGSQIRLTLIHLNPHLHHSTPARLSINHYGRQTMRFSSAV